MDAGIMVLNATYDSSGSGRLVFETDTDGQYVVNKIEAFDGDTTTLGDSGVAGRITYPTGVSNMMFAAFACNGVAAFDVSDIQAPSLADAWSGEALGLSALKAHGGPGGRMFVTFINWDKGGIGEFDINNLSFGPLPPDSTNVLHRTTWTTNALWPAPTLGGPNDPAFFVVDGAEASRTCSSKGPHEERRRPALP